MLLYTELGTRTFELWDTADDELFSKVVQLSNHVFFSPQL